MMRRESGLFLICSDDLADLVDVTPVGCRPGPPLITVDGSEIALPIRPFIPDLHAVSWVTGVGIALQEPQQFVNHRLQMDSWS